MATVDTKLNTLSLANEAIYLDIETVLSNSKAVERLIANIHTVIGVSADFLSKMNSRSLAVVKVAWSMKEIIRYKKNINRLIKGLEKNCSTVRQSQYLLIYAVYLDVICKDHYETHKMLKKYQYAAKTLSQIHDKL